LGLLWFGTGDGLNRYDKAPLSSNNIQCILEDSNGNVWVGTNDGLNRFNYNTGTFTVFHNKLNNSTSISNNYIKSLLENDKGEVWVGTGGGGLNKILAKQKLKICGIYNVIITR